MRIGRCNKLNVSRELLNKLPGSTVSTILLLFISCLVSLSILFLYNGEFRQGGATELLNTE